MKRVRITNDILNSYGTRVLTSGMDLEQYGRNPVLLYMHKRGEVIGLVKDLKVEEGEVTGELVFDEATELSQRCKKQWEFGSLKMVSAGLDIIELSDDPKVLVQGQTRPTITRSKLFEVSVVDIGANDDAIVLQKDGVRITLGKDGYDGLPLLNNAANDGGDTDTNDSQKRLPHEHNKTNPKNKRTTMDKEKIALLLGLPKDADEASIEAAVTKMQAAFAKQQTEAAEAETLRKELDTLRAARIEQIVNTAIEQKKIGEERRQQFIDLGKKIGAEELEKTFGAMAAQVKLSSLIGGGQGPTENDWKKLSDVPADKLMKLRSEDPARYKQLYKAEYGIECEM